MQTDVITMKNQSESLEQPKQKWATIKTVSFKISLITDR